MVTETKTENIDETLDLFKTAQEKDTSALLWFKSSKDVARMLLAWSKVTVRMTGKSPVMPTTLVDRWQWLWKNYTFSIREWCDLAAIVDYKYGTRLASRIIRLRLIFPDNTWAKWLEQYITLIALHETTTKNPKSKRGVKDTLDKLPSELEDEEEEEEEGEENEEKEDIGFS